MLVPGWELFFRIQVVYKTTLFVVKWTMSPSEEILALDILR